MKTLTNLKLINWHRFENPDPIAMGSTTLLSGENGSGKTTLLDAMMYVLLASSNNFNSAAHLNGKRKVTTYVRCKTGRENAAYERQGSITSHIALEFYEEERDKYFVLGAVIDSLSETQENTCRYLINDKRLEDIKFSDETKPLSLKEFRKENNIPKSNWFMTQREARAAFTNRLGRIEQRFFDLIPKAVAFQPIDDIKDFVYSYVLDEKDINIDDLRDYVQSYQELLELLERTKRKLTELEAINKIHDEVVLKQNNGYKFDYFIAQAELDRNLEAVESLTKELKLIKEKIKTNDEESLRLNRKLRNTQKEINDLQIELANNEEYRTLFNLKEKLEDHQSNLTLFESKVNVLKSEAKQARKLLSKEKGLLDKNLTEPFGGLLDNLLTVDDFVQAKVLIQDVINHKTEIDQKLLAEYVKLDGDLNELQKEKDELVKEIELLKNNQRSYPKNTEILYNNLKNMFDLLEKDKEPTILCEGLEITDESWRNAVEGYLNTQRFYILVDPEDYDYSLAVYDKLRSKKKIYGVGLINAEKLDSYANTPENSLASVVSTKNPYLQRYVNMVLGRVRLCENKDDLKKYNASITRECLKYQNHVASAIKPDIFKIPWIGQKSYRLQLKERESELKRLNKSIKELTSRLDEIKKLRAVTDTSHETYLLHNLDDLKSYNQLSLEIKEIKEEIKKLEKNKTIIQKGHQIDLLEEKLSDLRNEVRKCDREKGRLDQQEQTKAQELSVCNDQTEDLKEQVQEILSAYEGDTAPWLKEYEKKLRKKSYNEFIGNYQTYKKRYSNEIERDKEKLFALMAEFRSNHQFGAPVTMEGYEIFNEHYQKLKSSELVEYEDKVQLARENAEVEFREQFLSKLQENIHQAQNEFKELNRALKNVDFNAETYRFICKPNADHEVFYRLIMDPNNVGISVFTGSFYDRHKEEIKELFDAIKEDSDFEAGTLTDYRNYLSFDIEITDSEGNKSLYSKVCKEKSGGETQTPFYVAIAASFVQLYGNSISDESAGIIIFDEAFNNMDDERINGVLRFFKQLPLQVIISAPPDKIQYIAPYMDQINIIANYGKINLVHEYSNENLNLEKAS